MNAITIHKVPTRLGKNEWKSNIAIQPSRLTQPSNQTNQQLDKIMHQNTTNQIKVSNLKNSKQ